MRSIKSSGDLKVQRPCDVLTDLGKRRHMFADERLLVSLHNTLGKEDEELRATKEEIAEKLGTCRATAARAITRLKRSALVTVQPNTNQRCATIGNSYRLTDRGIRMARAIEATIVDKHEERK